VNLRCAENPPAAFSSNPADVGHFGRNLMHSVHATAVPTFHEDAASAQTAPGVLTPWRHNPAIGRRAGTGSPFSRWLKIPMKGAACLASRRVRPAFAGAHNSPHAGLLNTLFKRDSIRSGRRAHHQWPGIDPLDAHQRGFSNYQRRVPGLSIFVSAIASAFQANYTPFAMAGHHGSPGRPNPGCRTVTTTGWTYGSRRGRSDAVFNSTTFFSELPFCRGESAAGDVFRALFSE